MWARWQSEGGAGYEAGAALGMGLGRRQVCLLAGSRDQQPWHTDSACVFVSMFRGGAEEVKEGGGLAAIAAVRGCRILRVGGGLAGEGMDERVVSSG